MHFCQNFTCVFNKCENYRIYIILKWEYKTIELQLNAKLKLENILISN